MLDGICQATLAVIKVTAITTKGNVTVYAKWEDQ